MKRNAHDQNEEQEGRLEVDSMTQEVDSKTQSIIGTFTENWPFR